MLKIAVVILNYNGKHWLEKFLPNVIENTTHSNSEIIVADNASTDDSITFIKTNFPTVKIIQNKENTGYAGGYNKALKSVNADIYCLLNSDVEVSKNWLEYILPIFEDEKVMAAQPKILSYHNKSTFEYAGAAGGFIDKYGYPFCRGRIFDTVEQDTGQYNEVLEIFWASGACLFVRSSIFHQLGGFDEDFFAHQEEIDLCWRIKNLGYKILYAPKSVVYHVGGGTLKKSNPKKTFLNFRNNRFLLLKNLTQKEYQKISFIRNCLDIIAALVAILKGNFQEAKAIIHALKDFQKQQSLYLKKRTNNELLIRLSAVDVPNKKGIYSNSILYQYFVKGKKKFSEIFH